MDANKFRACVAMSAVKRKRKGAVKSPFQVLAGNTFMFRLWTRQWSERSRGCCKGFSVRIAERSPNRIRRSRLFEPLQQSLGLWMEGMSPGSDGDNRIFQDFYRIAGFQICLTGPWRVGELPRRNGIVDKGIVKCLRDLMAQCGDVLEAATECARRNPAGKAKSQRDSLGVPPSVK